MGTSHSSSKAKSMNAKADSSKEPTYLKSYLAISSFWP